MPGSPVVCVKLFLLMYLLHEARSRSSFSVGLSGRCRQTTIPGSNPVVPSRQLDRAELGEIEFDDRQECVPGRFVMLVSASAGMTIGGVPIFFSQRDLA